MYIVRQATYAEGHPSKIVLLTNFQSLAIEIKEWLDQNVSHLSTDVVDIGEPCNESSTFKSHYERQQAEAILQRLSDHDKEILKRHLNQ